MFMMRFRSNEQSAAIHQANFRDGIKAMRRILLDENLAIRSTAINRVAVNGR
jgi:negative regulator of replication initiation